MKLRSHLLPFLLIVSSMISCNSSFVVGFIFAWSFLTRFFKGLDFNKTEQLFFLLNILNSKWGWIFPTKESNNFNEEIFFHILEKLHIPLDLKTRNLNEKLIHLGLFSEFWTPADYVDSYFQDKNQSFSKVDINTDFEMDSVDYKEVLKVNKTEFSLFSKLLTKAFENNETVFELLSGTNIYRLKNFLSYCFKNQTLSVKNLFSKDFSVLFIMNIIHPFK